MRFILLVVNVLLCCLVPVCTALEPFECALLVNTGSQDSLEIGNFYADARGIPDENIVRLELPMHVLSPPYSVTAKEFNKYIAKPVRKAIEERGLKKRIRVWIYSADFPVRVETGRTPTLSLQGMTFTASALPSKDEIETGRYLSPLYRGPGPAKQSLDSSMTFDRSIVGVDVGCLVPSMMLAFTRSRGLTVEQAKNVIKNGVRSDASNPRGTVYFVKTEDIHRSDLRHWQFDPMRRMLMQTGVDAVVTNKFPGRESGIIGFQTGIPTVDIKSLGSFIPGAMAEHLTSWAACFDKPWHTKATAWLAAGATTTSGAVTEPYAIWMKFPTSFFFYHYRRGCTAIESYFQSVRCPMQILLLGEPLARPWFRKPAVTIVSLEDGAQKGIAHFFARAFPTLAASLAPKYSFYIDGESLGSPLTTDQIKVDTSKIPDGYHRMMVAVDTSAQVNVKPFGFYDFTVDNRGRAPKLTDINDGEKIDLNHRYAVKISAAADAESVGIVSRYLVLAEKEATNAALEFDPAVIGCGKVPIQAFARYPDGLEARSSPVFIEIARLNSPPEDCVVKKSDGENGQTLLSVSARDSEGDTLSYNWFRSIVSGGGEWKKGGLACSGGEATRRNGALRFEAVRTNSYGLCLLRGKEDVRELVVDMALSPGKKGWSKSRKAGLVFGLKDRRNFSYLGFMGDTSAWVLGVCRNGKMKTLKSRGALIDAGDWHRLAVRISEAGVSAYVDDRKIMTADRREMSVDGESGLFAVRKDASFRNLMISLLEEEGAVELKVENSAGVVVRISDGITAVYMDAIGGRL